MSLVVWLPLLGNLDNQGVSDISVTNNGATITSVGKLGKCYTTNGSSQYITGTYTATANMSFCIWVKFNSSFAGHLIDARVGDVGYQPMYVESNRLQTGGSTGGFPSFTYAFSTGVWYHLCVVYTQNNVSLYVNGSLVGTSTGGKGYDYGSKEFTLCCRHSHNQYYIPADVQDFRIYNHSLSTKDVEILARGLVVHYPLSLAQTNLLKNSNFLQGTGGLAGYTANYATLTKQTDCVKVVSSASNGGFYTNNFDAITTGDMTTFSAYVKADASMTIYIGTDGGGTSNCQAYTIGTTWKQISISKEKTTNNANLRIYGYGTFYAKLLKYELGSRITPWIPNSADTAYSPLGLSNSLEYDVSGNNYHGTKIGLPTYSSDTPRYSTSTSFNGVDDCIQVPLNTFFPNAGSFTINLWFKKFELGSKGYETVFGGISGFEMDTRNNTSTTLSYYVTGNSRGLTVQSPLNFDTWYMLTMVCDGTNELYYVNGEYKKQIEKKGMPTGNYFIGAWRDVVSQNFKGLISDFRVYATALTATQVAELYNTTTSISNT